MSYADLCNEATWQKRVNELEQQLAEARSALAGADALLKVIPDTNPEWYPSFPTRRNEAINEWQQKHAAALKAARENSA